MSANHFLDHALHYASLGWHVLPLAPGTKVAITPRGFHDATTNTTQIQEWWAKWPNANVAIATDESKLTVYDVDIAGGKLGAQSHAEIVDRLAPTLQATTRSGGKHLYYLAPASGALPRLLSIHPEGITAPPGKSGLDLLSDGYVLAPPSIVGGQAYSWDNGTAATIVGLPQVLLDAARNHKSRTASAYNPQDDGDIAEGNRNAELFKRACKLRNAGLSEGETLLALRVINETKVKPPLELDELKAIARSAATRAEFDSQGASDAILREVLSASVAPRPDADGNTAEAPHAATLTVDDLLDKMLLSIGSKEPVPPVLVYPTGFSELDLKLGGGFATRQLTAILGGPGAGKSALAVSFARHLVTPREGYAPPPILIVSTELEFFEVAARFASPSMQVPWRDILRSEGSNIPVSQACADLPVYVLDTTRIAIEFEAGLKQITDIVKHIAHRHGQTPVLIVDYLQQLASKVDSAEVRKKTGDVAVTLREISQRTPCAVLAITTVSREGYGNKLTAIRELNEAAGYIALAKESGQIEYEAATVLFVDVEEDPSSVFRIGRIVVAKSRHGSTGFAGAKFDPALGVYTEEVGVGQSMAKRAKEEVLHEAKVLQFVTLHPGEYTHAELSRELGVSPAVVASLVADRKIHKKQLKLYLTQNPIY